MNRFMSLGASLEFQSTNEFTVGKISQKHCLCWVFKVKSKLSQTERHCTWQLHFSARNAASRYTLWCICCSLWRISAPGTPGSKGRRSVDGKVKSGTWCWISIHFKTEGACLTTGVFNIKNGATLLSHYFAYSTTMVFWSSSDAWGNLLLQVFPNDAQCQVLPRIFCLNISHFQQDMHQPMAWWIFQPKHVTRGGCLENWGCHSSTCWWLVGRPDDQLANTEVDSQPLHVPVALRMLKIIPQLNLLRNTHFFPDNQNWETFFQVGFRRNGGGIIPFLSWPWPPAVHWSGASGPGLLPWNCTEAMALKSWICLEAMHLDLGRKVSTWWVDELVDWWVEELMCAYFFVSGV